MIAKLFYGKIVWVMCRENFPKPACDLNNKCPRYLLSTKEERKETIEQKKTKVRTTMETKKQRTKWYKVFG